VLDPKLGERLEHIWGRSRLVGQCGVIQVPRIHVDPRADISAPSDCATVKKWSTHGGDTRSFAQVLRSQPRTEMEHNGGFHGRQDLGGRQGGRFCQTCIGRRGSFCGGCFQRHKWNYRERENRYN
jgi:hypothetical protein